MRRASFLHFHFSPSPSFSICIIHGPHFFSIVADRFHMRLFSVYNRSCSKLIFIHHQIYFGSRHTVYKGIDLPNTYRSTTLLLCGLPLYSSTSFLLDYPCFIPAGPLWMPTWNLSPISIRTSSWIAIRKTSAKRRSCASPANLVGARECTTR